ncbi:unnamed protein product [Hymenolepis diminuta]|uniref:R3H-associated N-terminal domain-containing protein n=1 Tax=Hymenolepis diminuta TaxID=6216 RepID=A0A564XZA6_HYMDI|nr:unnamed protein product [Hymenolepis diminuta]
MALQTQQLQHYSDLGTTSESESSSVYSILPPYSARARNNNRSARLADNETRKKKVGSRAMRRQNNEAYLNVVLSILTPADESNEELDFSIIETDPEISGFSSLFNDDTVRKIWDEFISLDEKCQIELLSCLSSNTLDSTESSDDDSLSEFDLSSSRKNKNNSHRRRGNKRHQRRKPLVILETIGEDVEDNSTDAFESLHNCEELQTALLGTSTSPLITSSPLIAFHNEVMDFTDPIRLPTPGSLSPKLLDLIRSSVNFYSQVQGGRSKQRRKDQHFCLQDLCLINRVESELRWVFGNSPAYNKMWTPSTSLLHIHNTSQNRWIHGRSLVLNGFQRMLVHASATYLGLHSYSNTDVCSRIRRLWVDGKGGTFNPPKQPMVKIIYEAMQSMMSAPQNKEEAATE